MKIIATMFFCCSIFVKINCQRGQNGNERSEHFSETPRQ